MNLETPTDHRPLDTKPTSRWSATAVVFAFLPMAFLLAGCAGNRYTLSDRGQAATGAEALRTAEKILTTHPGWDVDCTGFVMACYRSPEMARYVRAQPPGRNLAQSIFRFCTDDGVRRTRFLQIQPGDILIFDKTYDANHDGHIDEKDKWTHAGIAVSFEDGLLTYIDASRGRKGRNIRLRSFSIRPGGKNERVAVDPATGRRILHRETFDAAFGLE